MVVFGQMENVMVARKSFLGPTPNHPELDKLIEAARDSILTDDQIREQRVSFAFGNAPEDSDLITKDSVRDTERSLRLIMK